MGFRNISVNFKVCGWMYRPPWINYVVNKPSTENSKTRISVNICPIELIIVSIESWVNVEFKYEKISVAQITRKEFSACEKIVENENSSHGLKWMNTFRDTTCPTEQNLI